MQLAPPTPFESPLEHTPELNQSHKQFYWNNCKSLKHRCEMWESWGYPREQIGWCKVYDRECATEVSTGTDGFVFLAFVVALFVSELLTFVYKTRKL